MGSPLPTPGADDGTWADLLNAYLLVSHTDNGYLAPTAVFGYRQLMLSYNGTGPQPVDCLVGEGHDPAAGGFIWAMLPCSLIFGGPGPNIPASCAVDSNGVIQGFFVSFFITGEGAFFGSYDSAGSPTSIYIQQPALDGNGTGFVQSVGAGDGIQVDSTDPKNPIVNSTGTHTLDLHYNGVGPVTCAVIDGLAWNPSTGGLMFIVIPAALCGLGEDVPAFAYVDNTSTIGWFSYLGNGSLINYDGAGNQIATSLTSDNGTVILEPDGRLSINAGAFNWVFGSTENSLQAPIGHKVWFANVLGDIASDGTDGDWALLTGDSSPPVFAVRYGNVWRYLLDPVGSIDLEAYNNVQQVPYAWVQVGPPYIGAQYPSMPTAPYRGSDTAPFRTLNAGDDIVVNLGQTITQDLWDMVDVYGTIIVWNADGSELLEANFGLFVNNSTGNQYLQLGQVALVGTDLSIGPTGQGGDNTAIHTAAGGSYNVLIRARVEWD